LHAEEIFTLFTYPEMKKDMLYHWWKNDYERAYQYHPFYLRCKVQEATEFARTKRRIGWVG